MSDDETPAVWEDFIDIFYAPATVYERRRDASPWPVLLALTLVLGVLFFAWQQGVAPLLDMEMERAMAEAAADGGGLSPEEAERMASLGRAFGVIGFIISFPLGVLVVSAVTWGLAHVLGAGGGFVAMVLVVTYAQIVRIAEYGVGLLQGLVVDMSRLDSIHDTSFSLARFLDQPEATELALGLAARVDLFTLWVTALIAIGLRVVVGASRATAWAAAVLVWVLGFLPPVLGALVGG